MRKLIAGLALCLTSAGVSASSFASIEFHGSGYDLYSPDDSGCHLDTNVGPCVRDSFERLSYMALTLNNLAAMLVLAGAVSLPQAAPVY